MSFMYTKKSNGPRTEPCGNPNFITSFVELNPLMETNCLLLVRYELNQSLVVTLIP